MELYDVVKKLVGPTSPRGESNADEERLRNTKELTELSALIINELIQLARSSNSPYASEKAIGDAAKKYLRGTVGEIKENIKL